MITKLVRNDSYEWDVPSVQLVKVARNGVDRDWIAKQAGEGGAQFDQLFQDVRPIPNRTILHVLAVGDQERYGYNRNGDGFAAEENDKHHGRFKSQGHVFLDHKHKDPALSVGEVLKTAHNAQMGRIEILLAADNKKCAKYLDKSEDGSDVPVSMGCTVKRETCSVCGHVAPRAKDRCEHIRNQLGQILKTGQVVGMDNPDPQYFDISLVWRPADRIGYSFRKIANDEVLEHSDTLADRAGMTGFTGVKLAAIRHVASIEKRIQGYSRQFPDPMGDLPLRRLKAKVAQHGLPQVLGGLYRAGYLLHPEDFCALSLPGAKFAGLLGAIEQEPGVHQLMDQETTIDGLDGEEGLPDAEFADPALKEACSLDQGPARRRAVRVESKVAHLVGTDPTTRGIALLYQHYKVAFAAANLQCPARLAGLAFVP